MPVPGQALVERDSAVASVCQLVLQPHGRVVTLTGVGGCGKTRLALAAATRLTA